MGPGRYMDMDRVEKRVGQVTEVRSGVVTVRIAQLSACTGCHARSVCVSSDCVDRYVTVDIDPKAQFSVGDTVVVQGEMFVGRLAVLLSFVLPLLLLLVSLLLGIKMLELKEGPAVLLALLVLGGYYGLLRLLDPQLGRVLRLSISKESGIDIA